MDLLVDKKQEYTTTLVNILTPLLNEGITSIYLSASQNKNEELKTFQLLLKEIPKWNQEMINEETVRIIKECNCDWLGDLVKAVVKSNVVILASNDNSSFKYITSDVYNNVKLSDFIHKCYIECAKEIYDNPILFYDKLDSLEIKRNQREVKKIIKDAIIEAIRKLLPVQLILKEYLGHDYKAETDHNIDRKLSDADTHNVQQLVSKDLRDGLGGPAEIDLNIKNTPDSPNEKDIVSSTVKLLQALKQDDILQKSEKKGGSKSEKKKDTEKAKDTEKDKDKDKNKNDKKNNESESAYYVNDNGNYEAVFSNTKNVNNVKRDTYISKISKL